MHLFELNSSGSTSSDSLDIPVTINDNDVASHSLSSNVNDVNENGKNVTFSISSNVRKSIDPVNFSITELPLITLLPVRKQMLF